MSCSRCYVIETFNSVSEVGNLKPYKWMWESRQQLFGEVEQVRAEKAAAAGLRSARSRSCLLLPGRPVHWHVSSSEHTLSSFHHSLYLYKYFSDRGNIFMRFVSFIIGWYKYFFGKGNIFESTRKYFWRTGSIFPWYQFNITHQSKVINQTEMSQDWMQVASLRSSSERLNTVNHFFHFRVSIVSIKLHYSRKM